MSTLFPEDPQVPARPFPGSYWVEPRRLLVGEFPGSRSRADTMDRLRQVLAAGITQFIDLTEASELPSYEGLLPFSTPAGRRIQYLRESIPDHGVPGSPEIMERILATLRTALDSGETVYLHCRAGVGRSAMVAGCYLVDRGLDATAALEALQQCWKQSAKSPQWVYVPETDEQFEYIRDWARRKGTEPHADARRGGASALTSRIRGALFGLAIGDIRGATQAGAGDDWTQHTALAICVAESLIAQGQLDAKDQMERFLKWKRQVQRSGETAKSAVSDDISKALATYRWRGIATAGSHDPRDRSGASLTRVLPAVLFACHDPAAAVALAAECSRTTHQGPVILDSCRYLAGMLVGALNGAGVAVALERYEPVDGLWAQRPLKREVEDVATAVPLVDAAQPHPEGSDVLRTLANARRVLMLSSEFETIVVEATRASTSPALDGAVCGALAGAIFGTSAIPAAMLATVPRVDILERLAGQFAALHATSSVAASRAQ
jgi:ADP-ribosylglycohydrolase/protein-tyrosine phosphatase